MDHLPLLCENIPEDLKSKLRKELNETEANVFQGLHNLREYIKSEKIPSRTDDDFLLCFLRANKFNMKKSEEKLKRYCDMRRKLSDFFEDIDVAKMEAVLDSQIVGFLPYRDKKGRVILFSRGYAWNKEQYDLTDSTKCGVLLILFSLTFPLTTMAGVSCVTDAKVNSFHDYYHNFRAFRTYTSTIMSLPCRFQRMDLVNENLMCHYFYAAIRNLLPTKFTKRVFMHGAKIEQLQAYYDASILPHEFGGTLRNLSHEIYKDKFLDFVRQVKAECVYFNS